MPDTIEQIKSRLDIVDVISGYLKVQKSGVNFKARCPFHNEKTPSFYISPERQIWHCFGCSKGGDVFGFIKEIEGIDFPEALRLLAARAGVELERFDPAVKDEKSRLYEACSLADKFFQKQLWYSAAGAKALAYLHDRGLTDETMHAWGIGWAPNDWGALTAFLGERKFTRKEVVDAGLALEKSGRTYDRFRSRITFPINDHTGRVVGFTARIFGMEQEGAKYVNSPQTLIYDKSRIIFGMDKAKTAIRSSGRALLVEGNMDAVMSWQAGVQNAVATSGTALTDEQLKSLGRLATTLDFCFDTDKAGALATRRGIGLALQRKFSVNVVSITDSACKDPADYVAKYGDKWQGIAAASKPVIQYYYDQAMQTYDPRSAESKKSVLSLVGPLIKRLTSRVEHSHWVTQLATTLRADASAIQADIISGRDDLASYEYEPQTTVKAVRAPEASSQPVPVDILSETLLSLAMHNLPLLHTQLKAVDPELLDPQIADIVHAVVSRDPAEVKWDEFLRESGDEPSRLDFIYLKSQELWNDLTDAECAAQFTWIADKLKKQRLAARLARLDGDIKLAEAAGDEIQLKDLMTQFSKLASDIAAIRSV